jgi:(4S)-4-hydroxy-5-phosphonooxypentane-2,3-dione isomerase
LRRGQRRNDVVVLKVDMLVKPGSEEKCKEYIRVLQQHSRREPGCLMYLGHQSSQDPRRFLFYEQYVDAAALEAHRNSPHFRQYVIGGLDAIMESRSRELYNVIE